MTAATDVAAELSCPSEQSRSRIIAAAAEIAAQAGYEGTTIAKITKRSGLPVSSVYWFFKDKDELLAEVVRHSYQSWIARQPTWTQTLDDLPWVEGLTANLQASLRGVASPPDFLRIGHMLTLQSRSTESTARALFLEIRNGLEQSLAHWYASNLPAAVVRRRPELPRNLAQVTLAATEGLFLAVQIDDLWDADEFVFMIVAVVEAAVAGA